MARALTHLSARGFLPRCVMDVGASDGHWTVLAHSLFPQAEYVLVEPLEEHASTLARLAAEHPQFRVCPTALGSANGTVAMSVASDLVSSSCLHYAHDDQIVRRTVSISTADAFLASAGIAPPDLLKIDVQGFELEVLKGAERLLARLDVLIVEVNMFRFMPECPLAHEVIAYLADRGFVLFDLAGQLRRPYQDDLGQLDLVFAAGTSPLVSSTRWV